MIFKNKTENCMYSGKEHNYVTIHRRFLKDYRHCNICGYNQILNYDAKYQQLKYDNMSKDYFELKSKEKKLNDLEENIKKGNEDNPELFKKLMDLELFVETDGLLESLLIKSIPNFNNDLNMFLNAYVDLLSINAEKEIIKKNIINYSSFLCFK